MDRHSVVVRDNNGNSNSGRSSSSNEQHRSVLLPSLLLLLPSFIDVVHLPAKHLIVTRLYSKFYVFHVHSHSFMCPLTLDAAILNEDALLLLFWLSLSLSLLIFLIELCAKNNRFYKKRIDERILQLLLLLPSTETRRVTEQANMNKRRSGREAGGKRRQTSVKKELLRYENERKKENEETEPVHGKTADNICGMN